MVKVLVLCLPAFALLYITGCGRSQPAPYISEPPSPVRIMVVPTAQRYMDMVGDGRIDVSVFGDFVRQNIRGEIVQNPDLARSHAEEYPYTCAISRHQGEERCTGAAAENGRISLRLRHWDRAPLTADDCRDLAAMVVARPRGAICWFYALTLDHIEADGHGCSYRITETHN